MIEETKGSAIVVRPSAIAIQYGVFQTMEHRPEMDTLMLYMCMTRLGGVNELGAAVGGNALTVLRSTVLHRDVFIPSPFELEADVGYIEFCTRHERHGKVWCRIVHQQSQ